MGDSHMGLQARLMSQSASQADGDCCKERLCRHLHQPNPHEDWCDVWQPETTPGGNALKFYASLRIEVRRSAQIKQNERIIGNRVKAKIVKNKVAPPFRTCEFDIMYNEGISIAGDMLDLGTELGTIEKRGNSYVFGEEKLGVGREVAKAYLKKNTRTHSQRSAKSPGTRPNSSTPLHQ